MSKMVVRVREAIMKSWAEQGDVPFPLYQSEAEAIARAVIEAMREPTEAMIRASREWDGRMSHRSSGAWQAMIDEALK